MGAETERRGGAQVAAASCDGVNVTPGNQWADWIWWLDSPVAPELKRGGMGELPHTELKYV